MKELYTLMVRRKGAEAGVNLRQIRRWFDDAQDAATDDKPADKGDKPDKSSGGAADKGKDKPVDKGDGDGITTLEAALAEIKKVRDENAKWRREVNKYKKTETEVNKSKEDEDDAKLLAEKNYEKLLAKREQQLKEAADKLKVAEVDKLREKIGRRHELPEEIVELLRGDNEEDIEAHAKKLKPLFAKQGDQGQGKKNGSTTTANPSGNPSKRTYEQIKNDIYKRGGDKNPFAG